MKSYSSFNFFYYFLIVSDFKHISLFNVKVEQPAPATLQPIPDLSLAPSTDTPEAAFDMIAAANLQPEATQELDSTHDSEDEEPAVLAETHDDASNELEEDVDLGAPEDEAEEEEIPLEEVQYNFITAHSL